MKENLKKILIEIPTIVIGVLIALAVNEWSVKRERDELADKVTDAIREELHYNRESVQKAYDYHVPLVTNLTKRTHRMFMFPLSRLKLRTVSAELLQLKLMELIEEMGEVAEKPIIVKKLKDDFYSMQYRGQMLTIRIENDSLKMYGRGNINLRSAFIRNNAWSIAQAAQIAPYLDFQLISMMSEIDQLHVRYKNTTDMIVEMLYKGSSDVTPAMQDMVGLEKEMLNKYEILDMLLKK